MDRFPVKYAVLRDQREWDGVTLSGLQQREDGALTLARVPAPADGQPVLLAPPFDADPSGIVLDHNALYISDTASNHVLFIDQLCGARIVLPTCNGSGNALGQFNAPRGLLARPPHGLYVADSGNARVQVLRLPTLELHAVWDELFQNPTCLAADSEDRIYVLDRGLQRVLRLDAWGRPDDAYNAAMAQQAALPSPFSLAVGAEDTLYVSDDHTNSVLAFDPTGKLLSTLPTINLTSPAKPRMLAAHRHSLYVADSSSGLIWLYDSAAKTYLGAAANFHGPVSAMAVDPAGASLYVNTAADQTFFELQTTASFVPSGTLITGPLDAGESSEWERAYVRAQIPASSNVQLLTFVTDNSTTSPGPSDWSPPAPCLDILIPPLPGDPKCKPGQKRYLWMQVQLNSSDTTATPTLLQVQAQTSAESYLDYMPAIYRKKDLPGRFLERWLALFRSELGDLEWLVENMPRLFDPLTTPEDELAWLATWLAFEFPEGKRAPEKRLLLARVHELYKRRGTPSGIREFIQLYAAAKAHLFEGFRQRRVWQLGIQSALGFDTGLAPSAPNGMIVPGVVPPDPLYFGLQAEYFADPILNASVFTRRDPAIDFSWPNDSPDPRIPTPGLFSVRWTGQIQPRYSERYTFHLSSIDGARLWIDDQEIIRNWTNPRSTELLGQMTLTAGRWYTIQLEYYRSNSVSQGPARIRLSWSSRSQQKEVVPQSRLYSILDDTADLSVPAQTTGCETLLVGQTVVGQSGPLQPAQFGTPLFSDTAHLFTVSLSAACVPKLSQRQELRRVVDAEKPAHTDFHLCFIEPRMRVGFQASIGIDSIIGGPSAPMSLAGSVLGLASVLGAADGDDPVGRVGNRARLGQGTVLG
jgi:phage tail-like protein